MNKINLRPSKEFDLLSIQPKVLKGRIVYSTSDLTTEENVSDMLKVLENEE